MHFFPSLPGLWCPSWDLSQPKYRQDLLPMREKCDFFSRMSTRGIPIPKEGFLMEMHHEDGWLLVILQREAESPKCDDSLFGQIRHAEQINLFLVYLLTFHSALGHSWRELLLSPISHLSIPSQPIPAHRTLHVFTLDVSRGTSFFFTFTLLSLIEHHSQDIPFKPQRFLFARLLSQIIHIFRGVTRKSYSKNPTSEVQQKWVWMEDFQFDSSALQGLLNLSSPTIALSKP